MDGTPIQHPMGMHAMMPMGTQSPMMGSMPGPYNGMSLGPTEAFPLKAGLSAAFHAAMSVTAVE